MADVSKETPAPFFKKIILALITKDRPDTGGRKTGRL
jgi:hypothetical protein